MMRIERLGFTYSKNTVDECRVLEDISFHIQEGEFIGLIGSSGSGKTTLIKHLNGLLKADSGAVYFQGQNIYDKGYVLSKLRKEVGLVFQYPEHQLFGRTVLADVCFGPQNLGMSKEEAEKSARDPETKHMIFDLVEEIRKKRNIAIVLVSHHMEDVAYYANKVLVLHQGRLVLTGEPEEVFTKTEFLREIGMDVPQITSVTEKLMKEGFPMVNPAITVKEAEERILKVFRERGGAE